MYNPIRSFIAMFQNTRGSFHTFSSPARDRLNKCPLSYSALTESGATQAMTTNQMAELEQ